ncbi:MAG TPA: VCBS repeat-containing protein, partial [Planctomycetota bacterium]|nr:VCBS repeat-containing protein [Planctomycetota bacterium]
MRSRRRRLSAPRTFLALAALGGLAGFAPAQMFVSAGTIPVGATPKAIVAVDVNYDGKVDLVTADPDEDGVTFHYGVGDGTFQPSFGLEHIGGHGPTAIVAGDLTATGDSELAVANVYSQDVTTFGGYAGMQSPPLGTALTSIALADLNRDGMLDVVAGSPFNATTGGGTVYVLLTTAPTGAFGTYGFAPATKLDVEAGCSAVALGDLNHDGHVDLATGHPPVNAAGNSVGIWLGTQSGSFGAVHEVGGGSGQLQALALGDLSGDGKLDVAATVGSQVMADLKFGTSNGFAAPTFYDDAPSPMGIRLADLDGDGNLDAVTGRSGASQVSVLLGTGAGTFGAATPFPAGTDPTAVAIADLNGDGKPDIAAANKGSQDITLLRNTAISTYATTNTYSTGFFPRGLTVGDFDGDGKSDVVTTGYPSSVYFLAGAGSGAFGPPVASGTGPSPIGVACGDLNADGKLDLVTANGGATTYSSLLGSGAGTFSLAGNFNAETGANGIALGDFDLDGRLDVVVGNGGANDVSVALGNGNGSFGSTIQYASGGNYPLSVAIGDVNEDGLPDVLAAVQGLGSVFVMRGIGSGHFGQFFYGGAGWGPIGVALARWAGASFAYATADYMGNTMTVRPLPLGSVGIQVHVSAPVAVCTGELTGDAYDDYVVASQFGDVFGQSKVTVFPWTGVSPYFSSETAKTYVVGNNPVAL